MLIYTLDDRAAWFLEKLRPIGTIEESLDMVFQNLLDGKVPDPGMD